RSSRAASSKPSRSAACLPTTSTRSTTSGTPICSHRSRTNASSVSASAPRSPWCTCIALSTTPSDSFARFASTNANSSASESAPPDTATHTRSPADRSERANASRLCFMVSTSLGLRANSLLALPSPYRAFTHDEQYKRAPIPPCPPHHPPLLIAGRGAGHPCQSRPARSGLDREQYRLHLHPAGARPCTAGSRALPHHHRDRPRHLPRAHQCHAQPPAHHAARPGQIAARRRHHQLDERQAGRGHVLH